MKPGVWNLLGKNPGFLNTESSSFDLYLAEIMFWGGDFDSSVGGDHKMLWPCTKRAPNALP